MTLQKKPNRVEQVENRLDRVERLLEQLAERQIHADNRLDRFEQALIASTQAAQEQHERTQDNINQLSAQSVQVSSDVRFLVAAVQGHVGQPSPPAHQE